ncbi:hypothetical protein HDF19_21775 [Mucilaginibacter sp. E4BP6]|uniref:hypothetical protein n=1 Tax=Mucilaginibacter sp. E4BP6 TaxID=2723089 RepID=UPI00181A63E6|nr:hypothetical protein [Mucilaginibacter sp. E4BP6]
MPDGSWSTTSSSTSSITLRDFTSLITVSRPRLTESASSSVLAINPASSSPA